MWITDNYGNFINTSHVKKISIFSTSEPEKWYVNASFDGDFFATIGKFDTEAEARACLERVVATIVINQVREREEREDQHE